MNGFIGTLIGGILAIIGSVYSAKILNKTTEKVTTQNIEAQKKLEQEKLESILKLKAFLIYKNIIDVCYDGFCFLHVKNKRSHIHYLPKIDYYYEDIHLLLANKKLEISEVHCLCDLYNTIEKLRFYKLSDKYPVKANDGIIESIYKRLLKNMFTDFAYNDISNSSLDLTFEFVFGNSRVDLGLQSKYKNIFQKLQDCSGIKLLRFS